MRKVLLFLVLAITFASCEGDQGPIGLPGEPGKPGAPGSGVSWYTESFAIKDTEWVLKGQPGELNSYYFADVKVAKLTDLVFDEGTIIGYITTDVDVKNGLPYVLHKGSLNQGKESLWTQTYDFDFEPGWVRFYITFSDFKTEKKPDATTTFHIVLMW